ncbi:ribonuclease T2-like, partial [Dissophora globulifera]
MKDMNTYWSSYHCDNDDFWSHEWWKHGTCVSTLAPSCITGNVQDEDVYRYFSSALALRSHHNLYQALAKHRILPGSGSPSISSLQAAIKAEFKAEASISCPNGVFEIRLFFHVQNGDQYMITEPTSKGHCS